MQVRLIRDFEKASLMFSTRRFIPSMSYEFPDFLQDVECVVEAGVKPFFTPISDHDLPAVGKRLVTAILPTTTVGH